MTPAILFRSDAPGRFPFGESDKTVTETVTGASPPSVTLDL